MGSLDNAIAVSLLLNFYWRSDSFRIEEGLFRRKIMEKYGRIKERERKAREID